MNPSWRRGRRASRWLWLCLPLALTLLPGRTPLTGEARAADTAQTEGAASTSGLAQNDTPEPPSPRLKAPLPAAQAPVDPAIDRMRADIRSFASMNMEGRGPGSKGLDRVASAIADEFRAAGLKPGGDDGDYFQSFTPPPGEYPVAPHPGKKWGEIRLQNVIGLLPGEGGEGAPAVVLGAHYDHLGLTQDHKTFTGADDNASGVAVLLELARRLPQEGPFANTIVLVAFSGEEEGVLGSKTYVERPAVPLQRTMAMLNLDTIGRMDRRKLYIFGSASAAEFPKMLKGINLAAGLDLVMPVKPLFASDQIPFFEKGIPVLHFFTGPNEDYHSPGDTEEKINYPGILEVLGFTDESVVFLANLEKKLTFVPPGAAAARPPAAGGTRRVSLGTIPDFSRESGGVLLSGTMPGSPAEKAGLQKGDLLTGVGPVSVDNLLDLSAALKGHNPGDSVEVVVVRGGQTLRYRVQLVERK